MEWISWKGFNLLFLPKALSKYFWWTGDKTLGSLRNPMNVETLDVFCDQRRWEVNTLKNQFPQISFRHYLIWLYHTARTFQKCFSYPTICRCSRKLGESHYDNSVWRDHSTYRLCFYGNLINYSKITDSTVCFLILITWSMFRTERSTQVAIAIVWVSVGVICVPTLILHEALPFPLDVNKVSCQRLIFIREEQGKS